MQKPVVQKITCFKCKHFFVTWNSNLPYGCKAWGVWARRYPDTVVRGASGLLCQLFEADPAKAKQKGQPTDQ